MVESIFFIESRSRLIGQAAPNSSQVEEGGLAPALFFPLLGQAGMPVLLNDHDHLALAAAVKLAKKNSLPAAEQKFSLAEGNSNGRTYQRGFDMRIGIFFAVPKAHAVLRDQ